MDGCMLIEPPKEFGGLDTIVNKPVVLNEAVGLLPESNFGGVAKIPAVANDSMLSWRQAGQHGRLRCTGHCWVRCRPRTSGAKLSDIGRVL